jgi:hypothetical protein
VVGRIQLSSDVDPAKRVSPWPQVQHGCTLARRLPAPRASPFTLRPSRFA